MRVDIAMALYAPGVSHETDPALPVYSVQFDTPNAPPWYGGFTPYISTYNGTLTGNSPRYGSAESPDVGPRVRHETDHSHRINSTVTSTYSHICVPCRFVVGTVNLDLKPLKAFSMLRLDASREVRDYMQLTNIAFFSGYRT